MLPGKKSLKNFILSLFAVEEKKQIPKTKESFQMKLKLDMDNSILLLHKVLNWQTVFG